MYLLLSFKTKKTLVFFSTPYGYKGKHTKLTFTQLHPGLHLAQNCCHESGNPFAFDTGGGLCCCVLTYGFFDPDTKSLPSSALCLPGWPSKVMVQAHEIRCISLNCNDVYFPMFPLGK